MSGIQQGWAARHNGTACAQADEVYCGATVSPFIVCCPPTMACAGTTNRACCPEGRDCISELIDTKPPACANSTWNLFDNGGYFCCEPGLTAYNTTGYTDGCALPDFRFSEGEQVLSIIRTGSAPSPTASPPISSPSEPASKSTPIGSIVGGVVGGVAAIIICIAIGLIVSRRRKATATAATGFHPSTEQAPIHSIDPKYYTHEVQGTMVQEMDTYAVPKARQEADGSATGPLVQNQAAFELSASDTHRP